MRSISCWKLIKSSIYQLSLDILKTDSCDSQGNENYIRMSFWLAKRSKNMLFWLRKGFRPDEENPNVIDYEIFLVYQLCYANQIFSWHEQASKWRRNYRIDYIQKDLVPNENWIVFIQSVGATRVSWIPIKAHTEVMRARK